MKLNKDKLAEMELCVINEDQSAHCCTKDGFKKLMVMYQHNKPVWAHKDCLVQESEVQEKPNKKKKRA